MNDEMLLPTWLVDAITLTIEKAYRRGYQQGLVGAENFGERSDDMAVIGWRSVPTSVPDPDPAEIWQGTPSRRYPEKLIERHILCHGDGLAALTNLTERDGGILVSPGDSWLFPDPRRSPSIPRRGNLRDRY